MLDDNRAFLIEEGTRFQQALSKLSLEEREKILTDLKTQWKREKRQTQRLLRQAAKSTGVGFCYMANGALDLDGETYSFGPHLWGEVDDTPQISGF